MEIALGLKPHSGWAALVALAAPGGEPEVVDRRRIELVEPADAQRSMAPYHAAHGLDRADARDVVERGIQSARRLALGEVRAAVKRAVEAQQEVRACALLVSGPMPDWSVEEILAVHFRMHKAEGALFRDALARAAESCGLWLVAIPEKQLGEHAERALAAPLAALEKAIAALGKAAGAPWGKDQKQAALAAWIALAARGTASRALPRRPHP